MFFAFVLDFDVPGAYNLGVRGISVDLPISPSLRGLLPEIGGPRPERGPEGGGAVRMAILF